MLGSVLFLLGSIFLGVGVNNVINAGELASHGIRVRAVVNGPVSNVPGQGPSHTLDVSYTTLSGVQEDGQIGVPDPASSYRIGSAITVVYDPENPSVVTVPKATSFGPWFEVALGAVYLLALAGALVWYRARARKRRSPVPATGNARTG